MVFQDGHTYVDKEGDFRVPVVFDNLIHSGDMPVTIGIFINPGHEGDDLPENPWDANNRSYEYDSLNGKHGGAILPGTLRWLCRGYSEGRD